MRRHYTDEQRAELIGLVTTRRATVSQAATRLGVTASTAYNWVRRAATTGSDVSRAVQRRQLAPVSSPPALTFVEVARATQFDPMLVVRVDGIEIEVRRGFDAGMLRDVVAALREEPA
jgi:transposase-like protein